MSIARFEKVSPEQFQKDTKEILGRDDICYDDIMLPKRATKGSAGYDFTVPFDIVLRPGYSVRIPTGVRCYIEEGYVLHLYPRSSLGFKYQMTLANTTGIIDSDYYHALNEGHIIAMIVNHGEKDLVLHKGDRFIQGIFLAYYTAEEEEVEGIRTGGFGSSNS